MNPYKYFLLVTVIILMGGVNSVFAASRSTPFTPGQTIDPGTDSQPCGPLDSNCFPIDTTIPKLNTSNVWTANNQFTNATSTNFFANVLSSISAFFTSLVSNTATIGSFTATSSAVLSYATPNTLVALDQNGKLVSSSTPYVNSINTTNANATSSFAGGVNVAGNGIFVGNLFANTLSVTDASTTRNNLGLRYATNLEAAAVSYYPIAAWGDSLTAGAGGAGVTYPNALQTDLSGRSVYNGGVGGETSTQIETRMVADTTKAGYTVIIWAGRNNYSATTTVEADIATMVASLGSNRHYLIMSVMNGSYGANEQIGGTGYNQIQSINTYLAATYPGHYIDIREYIIQYGLIDAGITPTSQDLTDITNDVPPTSLRYDSVHLNAAGYTIVARQVANFITNNLDTTSSSSSVITPLNIPSIFASPYTIGGTNQGVGYFSGLSIGTTTSPGTDLVAQNSVRVGGNLVFRNNGVDGPRLLASGDNLSLQMNSASSFIPTADGSTDFGRSSYEWRNLYMKGAVLNTGTGASYTAGSLAVGTTTTTGGYLTVLSAGNYNPTLTAAQANDFTVGGRLSSVISMGGFNSSPYGMWIQAQHSVANNAVNLALNPLGGGVTIGTSTLLSGSILQVSGGNVIIDNNKFLEGIYSDGTYSHLGHLIGIDTSNIVQIGGSYTQSLAFSTGGGGGANAMTIANAGNIGIGTTSPMSRLSIFQSANNTTGGISLSSLASSTRSIFMDDSNILHFSGNGNDATLNAAGAWTNASDRSYKENIVDLSTKYGLDTVLATEPRFYDMKGSHIPQVGFIAQELKPIIPEVVEGTDGSMGISYGNLVAVAFQAIKELAKKVDSIFTSLTTKRVTTEELCVDDVCVTKDQLKQMLLNAGGSRVVQNVQPIIINQEPEVITSTTTAITTDIQATSTDTQATSTDPIATSTDSIAISTDTSTSTPEVILPSTSVIETPPQETIPPTTESTTTPSL